MLVTMAASLAACAGQQAPSVSSYKRAGMLDAVSSNSMAAAYAEKCSGNAAKAEPARVAVRDLSQTALGRGVPRSEVEAASLRGEDSGRATACSADGQAKVVEAVNRSKQWMEIIAASDSDNSRATAQAAYDRAYAECQYQSDAALAGTRNFVDRVAEGSSLISQCMALKGYR
ncbi:hypothetical protein [Azospirillum sp. HJ39]|uniref:hypothetical protein n=1 Tax=Azospirillum sp. HJ39 TaxID=3159496 RepID=UPI00355698CD